MASTMKLLLPTTVFLVTRLIPSKGFSPALRRVRVASSRDFGTKSFLSAASSRQEQLPAKVSSQPSTLPANAASNRPLRLNLSAITQPELETLITAWGHPKFRAAQVWQWIHNQGVTDVSEMNNLPKKLREQLLQTTEASSLDLVLEQVSKDGTIKRAYRCTDGQVIESVLMPYRDGRYTACISSEAGCAQGCVFCATGQMGLSRRLTSDEIFEQVARFSRELTRRNKVESQHGVVDGSSAAAATTTDRSGGKQQHGRQMRLSNVVFMGMGEPLANYRNVIKAIDRITNELGIGARKITVSTVGVVPNIRKLMKEPYQVRLAVSLHCATDEERTALMPANRRFGGLDELMTTLNDYITTTGRRLTFEWALIDGQNDSVDTARKLGRLIVRHNLRRDMVHVNVIPLNPTGGFVGSPSQRGRVDEFCNTLEKEFSIACTPRVRRGIDIDAGCGQLKSKLTREKSQLSSLSPVGVYGGGAMTDDSKDDDQDMIGDALGHVPGQPIQPEEFEVAVDAVDFDEGAFDDPEYVEDKDADEAARLITLIKGTRL